MTNTATTAACSTCSIPGRVESGTLMEVRMGTDRRLSCVRCWNAEVDAQRAARKAELKATRPARKAAAQREAAIAISGGWGDLGRMLGAK